jgi:hypothetical protein
MTRIAWTTWIIISSAEFPGDDPEFGVAAQDWNAELNLRCYQPDFMP